MDTQNVIQLILGGIVGILFYFLKVIHYDVRRNTQNVSKNQGRIEGVKDSVKHEREMRQTQFDSIENKLNEIKEMINNKG